MLKIYIGDTAYLEDENLYLKYYSRISVSRKEKTDRFRSDKDKRLSVGAEALLMLAVKQAGYDYSALKEKVTENGKPYFENADGFFFSLSHSGTKAVCAVSDRETGCDIEEISRSNLKIARRFFTDSEYRHILLSGDEKKQAEEFCRMWTLKESFMKVTGLGFRLALSDFSVEISESIKVMQSVSDREYCFYEWTGEDGYRLACCTEGNAGKPEIIHTDYIQCGII